MHPAEEFALSAPPIESTLFLASYIRHNIFFQPFWIKASPLTYGRIERENVHPYNWRNFKLVYMRDLFGCVS